MKIETLCKAQARLALMSMAQLGAMLVEVSKRRNAGEDGMETLYQQVLLAIAAYPAKEALEDRLFEMDVYTR